MPRLRVSVFVSQIACMLRPERTLKRSRTLGGTFPYHGAGADFTPGPDSINALAGWPVRVLERLLGDGAARSPRAARLAAIMNGGFVLHTDCSGRMTPENMLQILAATMRHIGVHVHEGWCLNWRGTDILESSQQIMLGAGDQSPMHVFRSVTDHFSLHHQDALAKYRPAPGSSVDERRAGFAHMARYMRKHRVELYGRQATSSACLKHPGRVCHLSWKDPDPELPWQRRPLTAAIVGFPCTPFSPMGSKEGSAHAAMEVVHACIQSLAASSFDFVGIENSDHFPVELFTKELPEQYVTKVLVFGPDDIGFPMCRRRVLCVALNQEHIVWIGPGTGSAMEADFFGRVRCSVQLEADDFVRLDSPDNHLSLRSEFARRRGLFPDLETLRGMHISRLLCPSQLRAFERYKSMLQDSDRLGVRGSFCCDLSQDAVARPRSGPWFPTLTRSSCFASVSRQELFTNSEIDFAMGFPSLGYPGNVFFRRCTSLNVAELERCAYSRLAGNGMHVACMMSFWAYVLMNSVRRDVLECYRPSLGDLGDPPPFGQLSDSGDKNDTDAEQAAQQRRHIE